MKKLLMTVMILIAVLFMSNIIDANASNSGVRDVAGEGSDPC